MSRRSESQGWAARLAVVLPEKKSQRQWLALLLPFYVAEGVVRRQRPGQVVLRRRTGHHRQGEGRVSHRAGERPVDRERPLGWRAVGKSGPKDECLAYITEVWTDMRPLSLRKQMEEAERQRQASEE